MRPKTVLSLGAAVILVVTAAIAWHYAQRAHEARSAVSALALQRQDAAAEVRKAEVRLAAAEKDVAALTANFTQLQATAPAAPPPSAATATNQANVSIAERLQKEPDTQLYFLASQRAAAMATYGALFQALALSPEQVGKFQDLLVKREEQKMDLAAIAQAQGFATDSAEGKKLEDRIDANYQAAQRALLGETAYRQFTDYERTIEIRDMVNGWAGGAVVVAREPLTPQQGEQLVQILANANDAYRTGHDAASGGIDWAQADAQAEKLLSPAQFALFKTMEPPLPTGARFQVQMYQLVDQAKAAEGTANGSPPKPPGS